MFLEFFGRETRDALGVAEVRTSSARSWGTPKRAAKAAVVADGAACFAFTPPGAPARAPRWLAPRRIVDDATSQTSRVATTRSGAGFASGRPPASDDRQGTPRSDASKATSPKVSGRRLGARSTRVAA